MRKDTIEFAGVAMFAVLTLLCPQSQQSAHTELAFVHSNLFFKMV